MSNLFPGALDLTNEEYHADITRVSKSGLDLIEKSPMHYWYRYLRPDQEPREKSTALIMGSAIHTIILEPHLFNDEYLVLDDTEKCKEIGGKKPQATTKYKEWVAEETAKAEGKIILSMDDWAMLSGIRASFDKHPTAPGIIRRGWAEQTFHFDESETGAPVKIRPDFITEGLYGIDLKSTEDASPKGFGKSVANYNYLKQGAIITDGFKEATGHTLNGFIFIAVEKSPPYQIGLYHMTDNQLLLGRQDYLRDCATYMECKKNNFWPGYSTDIEPLTLPAWAYSR